MRSIEISKPMVAIRVEYRDTESTQRVSKFHSSVAGVEREINKFLPKAGITITSLNGEKNEQR